MKPFPPMCAPKQASLLQNRGGREAKLTDPLCKINLDPVCLGRTIHSTC